MDEDKIIPAERRGLWISVSFIIALLALVMSFVSIFRMNELISITAIQVMTLNQKIEKVNEKLK